MASTGGILAFVPLPEGTLDDAGRGILAEAGKLARALGSPWLAACPAPENPAALEGFSAYGTPGILEITSDAALADLPDALADAVAGAARHAGAKAVLMPHTDVGGTLAPGVAARLDAALFTEAVSFEREDGALRLRRRVLGKQVLEERAWDGRGVLVLTSLPSVLSAVVLPSMKPSAPGRSIWRAEVSRASRRVRVLARMPPDPQTVDVSEAEVIFCAGKGCDRASFEQLGELSRLLRASLGVTRPVYDLGWTGFERMIGQTGKTVTPRFYLGLGISGSMHHVGGIKDSKTIVTLNVDPKAPMFPNADEGFVADVREVLPRLLEKVQAVAGGAP